jgi:hypothetical protein
VDQLSRRGYRFFGLARVHFGDAVFEEAIGRVRGDEQAMRSLWRQRRAALDQEFEAYLDRAEPPLKRNPPWEIEPA